MTTLKARTDRQYIRSTHRSERFVLFQQLESLEEYVLVSQEERLIEVRRRTGRNWTSEVKRAGETIQVHGSKIAVDSIYG